jgi:hypothetical protein
MATRLAQPSKTAIQSIFPLFAEIRDLGFFQWTPGPSDGNLKSHADVTVADVTSRLSPLLQRPAAATADDIVEQLANLRMVSDSPPMINYTNVRFPQTLLRQLSSQLVVNKFPNDPGYIVPLYVAVSRGLSLADLDFVLGGSALDVLANRSAVESEGGSKKYLAQRVHNTIFIVKWSEYTTDYAEPGFQFERLLTGGRLDGKHDGVKHEHLQVARIGGLNVLFSADADAVDQNLKCVEIKSGNPRYFGTKVMMQMLSSGAQTLIYANKRGPTTVLGVEKRTLEQMINEHSRPVLKRLQDGVLQSLKELKADVTINEDTSTEINFSSEGRLVCEPGSLSTRLPSVLPKREVVAELLRLAGDSGVADAASSAVTVSATAATPAASALSLNLPRTNVVGVSALGNAHTLIRESTNDDDDDDDHDTTGKIKINQELDEQEKEEDEDIEKKEDEEEKKND